MHAAIGDRLVVRSRHIGETDKHAVILAVEGANGAPPYLVRWDDGHEGIFVPGPDAAVEHLPATTS